MSKKVKWCASDEGYTDSHCGRFEICPLPMGTTRAQAYQLFENDPVTLMRKGSGTMHDTQRDAKAHAQDIADGRFS